MSMTEINPKLFLTCRLCLKEIGSYQIVPSYQEQIKFCLDIDVQPFDGLPPLIGKKCEAILRDFSTKKIDFQQCHAELLSRNKRCEPKQNIDVESVIEEFNNPEVEEAIPLSHFNGDQCWLQAGYTKQYQCKLCSKNYQSKHSIINHLKTHKKIILKFPDVYNKWCNVTIEKFDNKHNQTGSFKTVVKDENTVLQNIYNKHYSIRLTAIRNVLNNNFNCSLGNVQQSEHVLNDTLVID